jgi:hypothetical protein
MKKTMCARVSALEAAIGDDLNECVSLSELWWINRGISASCELPEQRLDQSEKNGTATMDEIETEISSAAGSEDSDQAYVSAIANRSA